MLFRSQFSSEGFPGPIQVISQTWDPYIINPFFDDGGTSKGLGLQLLISLQRVAVGYTLAAVVGIAAGLAIGLNRFLRRGFDPLIQVLRTVPPLAWLPISLLLFQQADTAAIFVIFITAIWPIIINTAVGINEIPQDYTNVARVLRLRKRSYLRDMEPVIEMRPDALIMAAVQALGKPEILKTVFGHDTCGEVCDTRALIIASVISAHDCFRNASIWVMEFFRIALSPLSHLLK